MALEPSLITAAIALVAGIGYGAFWSWFGYISKDEEFNVKKFTLGIVTGAIGGLAAALANLSGLLNATDAVTQLTALVGLFFIVGGVDKFRTNTAGTIANTETKPTV